MFETNRGMTDQYILIILKEFEAANTIKKEYGIEKYYFVNLSYYFSYYYFRINFIPFLYAE